MDTQIKKAAGSAQYSIIAVGLIHFSDKCI